MDSFAEVVLGEAPHKRAQRTLEAAHPRRREKGHLLGQEGCAAAVGLGGRAEGERSVPTEEVKVGCTLAMLRCRDRPHRLAYVLGRMLEPLSPQGAHAAENPSRRRSGSSGRRTFQMPRGPVLLAGPRLAAVCRTLPKSPRTVPAMRNVIWRAPVARCWAET